MDHFPVVKFCDEIESTGAKWVIWPFGHGEALFCAPNAALESMAPGCCSKRDLFGEIADNLTGRGLKVMAYLTTNACGETFPDALGWN